ncbi:hypothetical protein [Azospirillum sp. sgz302134]
MTGLTHTDRILLRTALKAAKCGDVPSVGMPTGTLERLLAYLAELESAQAATATARQTGAT